VKDNIGQKSKISLKVSITGVQADLTPRELEVLCFVAKGATNTEISTKLSISHHTIKSHVVHIFNKLGVNDRTQAAVWAAQNKIL
jgi:DNA-binding NarL/FixJ family response regulator